MFHRTIKVGRDLQDHLFQPSIPSTTMITHIPKCHINNNYFYIKDNSLLKNKTKQTPQNAAPIPAQEMEIFVKWAESAVCGARGCHTTDCSGNKQRSGNGSPNLLSSAGLMQTIWALTWGWGQRYLMKSKGLSSILKNTDSGNCFFINPCLNSLSVILVT